MIYDPKPEDEDEESTRCPHDVPWEETCPICLNQTSDPAD